VFESTEGSVPFLGTRHWEDHSGVDYNMVLNSNNDYYMVVSDPNVNSPNKGIHNIVSIVNSTTLELDKYLFWSNATGNPFERYEIF
jgi:hypothetical protein